MMRTTSDAFWPPCSGLRLSVTAATTGQTVWLSSMQTRRSALFCAMFRMPRMNGMGFLDAVSGRGLQVVMMSAYGTTDTAVEALGRGAADLPISKPFRPDEIRVSISV